MYRFVLINMSFLTVLKIPFVWGFIGLIVGSLLGGTTLAVWLIALLLVGFLVFMKFSGPPEESGEGALFAGGSLLMIGWILGFSIRGILL